MKSSKQTTVCIIAFVSLMLCGCDDNTPTNPGEDSLGTVVELEQKLRNDLDALVTDTDFTLTIKTAMGRTFSHSTGVSNDTIMYKSASTSKLVTAVIILSLVEDGILSLEDHPQDYIDTWSTTGNLAAIELKHLLSFTSGLANDPRCNNYPDYDFESCVGEIAALNSESTPPGEEFYYSSAHLQVAGLMAIKALGFANWQEVFERFKADTELFAGADYDLPSLQNPRLAGGMHWNAEEYLGFLEALYLGRVLSSDMVNQMTRDQIGDAVIGYSPVIGSLDEDWHYGYGNWIECHANPNNCVQTTKVSCPGAYGAYPFIDFENNYFGILARQGSLGTFDRGYEAFEAIANTLEIWAAMEVLSPLNLRESSE